MPRLFLGCTRSTVSSRTSVSSNSVTVITPGTGSSITSTMTVLRTGMPLGCIGCTSFGKTFVALARPGLAFAKLFGIGLAADRFAAFPRADLEVLDLPRTADLLVRNVACFFCRAMFAPYAVPPKRVPSPVFG